MKEMSYWKQFMDTGRIEDYLSYRAQETKQQEAAVPEGENNPYAGICDVDRDDHQGGARG